MDIVRLKMKQKTTVIRINIETAKLLITLKQHKRESYNDVLQRMLKGAK